MADEYIDGVVSLVHFDGVDGDTSCIDAATGAIWKSAGAAAISSEIMPEISLVAAENWWTAAPNLAPVAAWDASRVDGAQLLDGVGNNHITATSPLTIGQDSWVKSVAGNSNPMALTTAIPMPVTGVVAGFWSPKRSNVLLSHALGSTSGYALHISTDRRWYSTNGSGASYGLYGYVGVRYFVAMVMRGSDSILYVNGDLVGTPLSSSYTMNQIGQVGYGGNGNEHNLDADEYLHALGVWTGEATQADVRAIEAAARSALWQPSLAKSRFGGASFIRGAPGGRLSTQDAPDLNMEGYDFTVELWFYPLNLWDWSILVTKTGSENSGFTLGFMGNGALHASCSSSSSGFAGIPNSVVINAWSHIALTRSGNTARLFLNGVLKHVWSDGTYLKNKMPVIVGDAGAIGTQFEGYIDELRITKGVCRYYSDFTVPDTAFDDPLEYRATPPLTARSAMLVTGRREAAIPEHANATVFVVKKLSAELGRLSSGVPQYLQNGLATALKLNLGRFAHSPPHHWGLGLPAPHRFAGLEIGRSDRVNGGGGRIMGRLLERGVPQKPMQRELKLLDEVTGVVIATTWSRHDTGEYQFNNIDLRRLFTVLAYDHAGVYKAVVASGQRPTTL